MALKLLFWLSLRFRPGHQVQYVDKAQDSCRNFLATDPAAQLCGYLATGQPCKPVHRFCQPENLHVIATAATHSLSTVLSPRQGRPRHRSDDWPRDGAYDMQRFLMKPLSLKVFVNLNSVEASIRQRTTPPPPAQQDISTIFRPGKLQVQVLQLGSHCDLVDGSCRPSAAQNAVDELLTV